MGTNSVSVFKVFSLTRFTIRTFLSPLHRCTHPPPQSGPWEYLRCASNSITLIVANSVSVFKIFPLGRFTVRAFLSTLHRWTFSPLNLDFRGHTRCAPNPIILMVANSFPVLKHFLSVDSQDEPSSLPYTVARFPRPNLDFGSTSDAR